MAPQPPLPDAVAGWIVGIWGLERLGTFNIGRDVGSLLLTHLDLATYLLKTSITGKVTKHNKTI
jgi:hypothetical protein